MSASALVLAAGAGRRFGGPKQLHTLPAVLRAARALDRVCVVLGAHADRIRDTIRMEEDEVALCAGWAEGQAASLRCGVAALGGAGPVVVLLGDMPGVTGDVVRGAVTAFGDCDVLRTVVGGRPTHPVVLGPRALARVPDLRGDVGARALFGELRVREWHTEFDARDVDLPSDLAR